MEIFTVKNNSIEVYKVLKDLEKRWYVGPGVVPGGYIVKSKKYFTSFEEASSHLEASLKKQNDILSKRLEHIRMSYDALLEGNIPFLEEKRVIIVKKKNKGMELNYRKNRSMYNSSRKFSRERSRIPTVISMTPNLEYI